MWKKYYNYNFKTIISTIENALLENKVEYIDEFNAKRKGVARQYTEALRAIKEIVTPSSQTDADHVFHQYTLRILNGKRDNLQKQMKEKGIDSMVYYPVPLHKMRVFQERIKIYENLTNSEDATKQVLSLPIEPLQKKEFTELIVRGIINSM